MKFAKCIITLTSLISALIAVFPYAVAAGSDCIIGDLSKALSEEKAHILQLLGGDWIKKAKICDLGFYKIAAPSDGRSNTFFIWTEKGPFLIFEDGFGLNLFSPQLQGDSSEVLLTLQDRDKNGLFHKISYKTLDDKGLLSGEVVDFNMDGQPDLKLLLTGDKKAEIWLNGRWHDLGIKDGQKGVYEDKEFRPVYFEGGKWQLKK